MYNNSDKIYKVFGHDLIDADFGVEIEMEGQLCPFPNAPKGWRSESDGSLHGEYNVEYISKPIMANELPGMLSALKKRVSNADVEVQDSVRAGVHIHLNMLDYTVKQTFATALTYLAMERVLVNWCGPNRVGNHFCLRLSDAEWTSKVLGEAIYSEGIGKLNTNYLRYSSLNFASLGTLGTLEFRALQTHPDLSKIQDWANILYAIREYGSKLENYSDIADNMSFEGPEMWVRSVLGDRLYNLVKYKDMELDLMTDLRNIQPLLYGVY